MSKHDSIALEKPIASSVWLTARSAMRNAHGSVFAIRCASRKVNSRSSFQRQGLTAFNEIDLTDRQRFAGGYTWGMEQSSRLPAEDIAEGLEQAAILSWCGTCPTAQH
jgi:hypothetical protein